MAQITIGSDPEAVWVDRTTGLVVKPAELARILSIGFGTSNGGIIGADGASGSSSVAEFRPDMATTPTEHFENIKNVIDAAYSTYHKLSGGRYILVSGTKELATGGHIHFGGRDLTGGQGNEVVGNCIANLDYWVAPLIMPYFNKDLVRKRFENGYGKMGDARSKDYGFEYRTLPSWISSPIITEGVLCLAYVIVKATVEHKIITRIKGKDIKWVNKAFAENNHEKLLEMRTQSIPRLMSELNTEVYGSAIKKMLIELKVKRTLDVFDNWGKEVKELTPESYKKEWGKVRSLIKPVNIRVNNTGEIDYDISGVNFVGRPVTKHTKMVEFYIEKCLAKKTDNNLKGKFKDIKEDFDELNKIGGELMKTELGGQYIPEIHDKIGMLDYIESHKESTERYLNPAETQLFLSNPITKLVQKHLEPLKKFLELREKLFLAAQLNHIQDISKTNLLTCINYYVNANWSGGSNSSDINRSVLQSLGGGAGTYSWHDNITTYRNSAGVGF